MEQLTSVLARGARGLGLDLSAMQIRALEEHLFLLAKWNAKLNLVGPGALETWAAIHTLDSLAVAEWVEAGDEVIDVGSGAGFPGIPCAVVRPDTRFCFVEPRANRASFLQNVIAAIGLRNAAVKTSRAETEPGLFDVVLGRAVAQQPRWATLASKLCVPGGGFVLFSLEAPPARLGEADSTLAKAYDLGEGRRRFIAKYVPRGTPDAVS